MSKLVTMRQRIKAIQTIKKITHAMRLISMSTHSQLKHKEAPLSRYHNVIEQLFYKVKQSFPSWHNPVVMPHKSDRHKDLIILIGSQKGLCGTFNSLLFKSFDSMLSTYNKKHVQIIAIGKRAAEYATASGNAPIIATFDKFTAGTYQRILKKITKIIMDASPTFHSVTVVSNVLKTFFIQKPKATSIIPLTNKNHSSRAQELPEDYVWEQPAPELLDTMAYLFIQASIEYLLFQSLLAEQAARFLSMDSATRNAEGLLEKAELTYNKLRQAKITKELTELAGSY